MIDPEHEQIAMLETARAEREAGDHSAAVRSFEAAASLAGELGDEATECLALDELAVTLRNLSDSGAKRGDAEAMQRHALDLLALARRRGDVVAEAEAMNRCGVADLRNGQVDAARRRFEQALDIYRTAGSAAGEERVLANLGIAFGRNGHPEKAIECFTAALKARPGGKTKRTHAGFFGELATLQRSRGHPNAALMALQQRLDLAVEIGDLEMEAGTRLRIGAVQAELWRLDTARREYDRAREIASGLTERALEGLAFNNIGRLLDQTGDTAGARQFYARALEISLDSADRYLERVARNNLAMSAESDEDRIDQLEAVASLARDLKDRRAEALTENNLGHTFSQIGRTEDAERHYLRALSINQSLGDLASLTLVENNLAMLRLTSMPARAKDPVPWYKPHRRRFLVRLDRGPRIWVWYMTLGIRLTSRRSLRAARAQFKQSLERYENNGNILGMVTALQNLAIFELHRGKHKQSLSRFRQLFEVLERARAEVASEELQTQFFAAHQSLFDMVIPLLVFRRQGEGAFELAERARSRTLLDIITTQTDPEQLPTLASRRIELLEKLRKSDHEWRASDSAEPERKQLEREITDVEWELRGLNRSTPPNSARGSPLATVERVQKDLIDDGTALLEYRISADRSTLFCITRKTFKVFNVPSMGEIEARVRELVAAVSSGLHRYPHGSELYRALVRPAERTLRRESISSLLIVADGVLNSLPFSLLLTEDRPADRIADPDSRLSGPALAHRVEDTLPAEPYDWGKLPLLLRRYAVGYVPSASIALAIAAARPPLAGRPPTLAAFAATSDGLKHCVEEIRAIERLINDPTSDLGGSYSNREQEIVVRTGAEATKDEWLRVVANRPFTFVHCATHGLLNEERPLLSGLMFASNREDDPDPDLLVLDLREVEIEAEIVVLSACETGLGKLVKGEGVVGLSRAFLSAGARSLCVSLWNVSDRSAPRLMAHLYRELIAGRDRCEALRRAQLQMLDDPVFAHPYHWAPFVFTGACAEPVLLGSETKPQRLY